MVEVPLPLLAIAFVLGAVFLYLGVSYLNITQSQSLHQEALAELSLASDACNEEDYDSCLQKLLDAESKLIEARSKLNPYDSWTYTIYSKIEDTIDEVDLLLTFVYFSKKLGDKNSFEDFNLVGSKGNPCEIGEQANKFLGDLKGLEEDIQLIRNLADAHPEKSYRQILQTIEQFEANKRMVEIFSPAFDATCTIKTEIEPKIDPNNDLVTVINLRGNSQLEILKEKLNQSLEMCFEFVKDKERARTVNFTIGECLWVKNNLDSVNNLIELVSNPEIVPPEGFTTSKMFVTIKDYSDLVTMVDPTNDEIRLLATKIARDYPGGQSVEQADAIFKYVRDEIVYLLPPLTVHQRVQKPEATLQLKAGNCADKSVFAASLYMAVGYPVKAVLQDRHHTPQDIEAGAKFAPDHMFVRMKVGDKWYTAEVTCSNCPFNVYTSVNNSTLLEMDVPVPV